jgi:hypothetical protein
MACLPLFTFLPLLPLLRVPRLRLRIGALDIFPKHHANIVVPWFFSILIRAGSKPASRLGHSEPTETTANCRYLFQCACAGLRWLFGLIISA